ncbi:hypothetical protein [Polyangium jinanense]|uniref:LysM domain-containing protein n=1 Tax=Polyangium jinanense TaxID=2829994 RepID=A0A9X3XDP0_9BACT|nr:hypothetical protein [Polyangium jinanense]MDC3962099.1 hypothetical protein [Polyangium jinanense]MDC3988382.1 hypothetical protein [Polyangium jinanense]
MRIFRRALMVAMLVAGTWSAASAGQTNEIVYEITDSDTLYVVATRYYGDPAAFKLIFKRNEAILRDAYGKYARDASKRGEPPKPFGTGTIWPKTKIVLPQELSTSAGVLYERRSSPLKREVAEKIARKKRVNLDDLEEIAIDMRPRGIKPPQTTAPLTGYAQVSSASSAVSRETPPKWYEHPENELHRCAVAVCGKFQSLCYYECLAVAKRFLDGGASCSHIPATLPYDQPEASARDCSGMLE